MRHANDRSVTLCMVVKDEAARIADCLHPLLDAIDEILVVDTGSSDGTPDLLKERFGITVLHDRLHDERCLTKIDVRNRVIAAARTSWILSLDADEVIAPEAIRAFRNAPATADVAGYFGLWRNHLTGAPAFDDYKCFLFRSDRRMRGLVHENAQSDMRAAGLEAHWLPELTVSHYPAPDRHQYKTELYERRLRCALRLEPGWHRYDWFLGYMLFQQGRMDEAAAHLERAWASGNPLFPVERLNSAMVLTDIRSLAGQTEPALALVSAAYAEWHMLADDFEVRINHRLGPWFAAAQAALEAGDPPPKAYRFAR
jgi:glycosyltransferase involved in cell wall biosynthesis